MRFKVNGVIICDDCKAEVSCVFTFRFGDDRPPGIHPDHPEPEQGHAFNSIRGAEYLCANCYELQGWR